MLHYNGLTSGISKCKLQLYPIDTVCLLNTGFKYLPGGNNSTFFSIFVFSLYLWTECQILKNIHVMYNYEMPVDI
jgi:hypothetical protein